MKLSEIKSKDLLISKEELDTLLSPYYDGIFRLLDGVISINEKEIIALKNIDANDPILTAHMKGKVYSGFLSAEFFSHACIVMMLKNSDELKGEPRVKSVGNISFNGEIKPGDQIRIFAKLINRKKRKFLFAGHLENQNGETVFEISSLEGMLLPNGFIEKTMARAEKLKEKAKNFIKKIL